MEDLGFQRLGNDLVITHGNNDQVTLQNYYGDANNQIEWIEFAQGGGLVLSNLLQQQPLHLSSGDDDIGFGNQSDIIYAGAGNDVIHGNGGNDTLYGEAGDDTLSGGAGSDLLNGGSGNDLLEGGDDGDAYVFRTGDGQDRIHDTGGGNDVLRFPDASLEDVSFHRLNDDLIIIHGDNDGVTLQNYYGNANNRIEWIEFGQDGGLLLADLLQQQPIQPILRQGGDGDDSLSNFSGKALLDGGAGNDTLSGGTGAELYLGGTGDDTLITGAGNDLLLFNAGDGQDSFTAGGAGGDVLSLGGGIAYGDLAFGKSGNDLILSTGGDDQITFQNWYAASASRTVVTLQMIAEAMEDFAAGGANPLLDQKIETFDFAGLVDAFDAARADNPGLTSWALTNALLDHHLSGSDTAALGGDLAYQYGRNGTLADVGIGAAQEIIGEAGFGSQAQTLKPLSELQAGPKLG
jgi:Ca2+-binding RTX toxin-like protein